MGCPMSRRFCETWELRNTGSGGNPRSRNSSKTWVPIRYPLRHHRRCGNVHSSQTDITPLFYSPAVPENLHRTYGARDLHFLTFSCYHRQPLLNDASRCDLLLQILERVRRRYRLVVQAYVVMPEHVHLLVTEPQRADLSTAMQALKLGFIRSLDGTGVPGSRNDGETRGTPLPGTTAAVPNPFWQARFYDFNVWTEKRRIEKLRYIHRNPVTRGLVASPEQWRWSSFRWYLCREERPS
jgi:putative transposase